MDRLDLAVSPRDVELFFYRYDSDQDGRLGFWEMSNSVLPLDLRQRDEIEQRQATYQLSYETRELLKRVLRKAIETEAQVEHVRHKLQMILRKLENVDVRQIFSHLDWINRGFICKSDIKRIVDQFSEHLNDQLVHVRSHPDSLEMEALFRRFNKDK
mmetsp:Transcript_17510/g.29497  ORF Transcript_17510/g.29497 Transcript_17510/m.29497 type:complete len:157 (+) Transcript_17510:1538-2008(+)